MSEPVLSLNDYTDNNEQLLKAMGFNDENEIKQALCLSNNDINEAVAILTNEKLPKITSLTNNTLSNENDIDMTDTNLNSPNNKENKEQSSNADNPLIFPYDCLIQLENNVFTDNWSIPYKKDEWLGRLLVSTIALLKEGIAEADQNCKRFLDRVIPEVYKKLLDSNPVLKWSNDIQLGVYNMTCMVVELIAIRLSQNGVPEILLNTLTLILNPENAFHNKNMHRIWDKAYYVELCDGIGNIYTKDYDTHGWLLNLINIFGTNKGFDAIKVQLEKSNDINDFNLLLKPLASCSNFLNTEIITKLFENPLLKIFDLIKKLDGEDFKDKNVGKVFDLLATLKKLFVSLWQYDIENFHCLHLNVVLNMLKYPQFNSKMNSLKEICKLIDHVNSTISLTKLSIKEDVLSEWIISQRILSLAVEGNIDQGQYCEKIKTIVEFIGDRIKNEEILALWEMQYNKSMSIIDNLYLIIGIAATKFNPEQLDYLLAQIIQTWNNSSFKLHDKLVGLLRIIGREAKSNKTCSRILEALWELKNRPGLSRQLLLLIYTEHLNVLSGGRLPREMAKREYLKKCIDDIKKAPGSSIAIASLKHMYDILNSYQKNSNKALKDALTDIVVPIMKNLCTSLLKCHANAYDKAKLSNQKFDQTALIDDLFTHEEVVQTHLNSIKFILQEGNLYLNLSRAQDIWNVLINNEHSCDWDKKIGFEWFIDCWPDLNDDTRMEIFKKQILNLQTSKLSLKGYECFKLYFTRVNEHESKIQIKSDIDNFYVEKLDLTGLNFLWDIILYVNDEKIADLATKFLLELLFEKVSMKLKRELVQLHQRFINECYTRLENCLVTLDSSPIGQLLLNAFRISYISVSMTEMSNVPIAPRSEILKCIERLLMIAERYIITVEESQMIIRTNLPHFVTYKSESFSLVVIPESRHSIELFACSNETLGDLRVRIANALCVQTNNVQIYNNDKLLNLYNDMKLLTHLNIDGMQPLNVKIASYPSSLNQTPVKDSGISFGSCRYDSELEKSFPGVLIANGGSAFEMLYRLEDLDEPKIRTRVRNILKLIPTNPKLLEAYDRIIGRMITTNSSTSTSSTASVAAAGGSSGNNSTLVKSPSVSSMISCPTYSSSFASSLSSSSVAPQLTSQSTPSTPTFSNSSFMPNQSNIANSASSQVTTSSNVQQQQQQQQTSQSSSLAYVTNSAVAAMTSLFMKRTDSSTSLDSRSSYLISASKDFAKFFDKSLPLHRILYHLEALSSRLMPSTTDTTTQQNAELFQQDFLKANGLEVLISLLKLENTYSPSNPNNSTNTTSSSSSSSNGNNNNNNINASSSNNNYSFNIKTSEYETKQDIYILLLQLLRLILFGSYYPISPTLQITHSNNCVNKRPSTEPITTCAKKTITPSMIINPSHSGQNQMTTNNINTSNLNCLDSNCFVSNLDGKNLNLIQKMSINEIIDIIVQLLIIFWSAAAGNLQLAYCNNMQTIAASSMIASLTNPIDNLNSLNNKSPARTISNSSSSSSSTIGTNNNNNNNKSSQLTTSQQMNTSTTSTGTSKNKLTPNIPHSLSNLSSSGLLSSEDSKDTLNTSSTLVLADDVDLIETDLGSIGAELINRPNQKEVKFFIPDHRLSTGSNMSTSSIDSVENQQLQCSPLLNSGLVPGICIKQTSITSKDIKIASKSIEMIACFVQYRKDCIGTLFGMKLFNECIIDVLTGSIASEVRAYIEKFLLKLCQIETPTFKCKDHLINVIIKARLPLWVNSSLARSSTQRLISQSAQYFNLRSALLENMTIEEQSAYSIDLAKMLNDEVNWLIYFTPTRTLKEVDNILLTGHLCLTRALLTCETANKSDIGFEMITPLIKSYLFPAAFLLNNPTEESSMEPICSNESSRMAAYKLLTELSRNCYRNFQLINKQLILFHHSPNPLMANEWNYIPLVTPRAECGFVGLKNGGATCYMNAVLQQLFMMPGVPEYLLSIEDESDKKSVFYQLQNVFAHLKESKLEYYIPESFWKAFRMWGQEVNIREQQDAFDFFISMTDQIDEHLKKIKKEPLFKNIFEGTFSNQFICKDCPHKYEREEAFLGLNLPIKAGNLQESLLQFVKDELLDGENSYNCEKCNEKRSAIKRTCIKKLPKYLCIQLKRFDYDWESNRSLKFDDYFQFPRTLDVSPYMYESINKVRDNNQQQGTTATSAESTTPTTTNENIDSQKQQRNEETTNRMDTNSNSNQKLNEMHLKTRISSSQDGKEILYDLVGIVVHSGQANAGHYYSFIKGFKNNHVSIDQELFELERLNQSIDENEVPILSNHYSKKNANDAAENGEKWYKFNDTSVEEINLTENTLIEECFGGTFTQSSDYKMLPEERVRYWNGYMLFYREVTYNGYNQHNALRNTNKLKQRREQMTTGAFKSTKLSTNDSLSELAELVSRGDEKGIFSTCLPPSIEQTVKSENLEFCKNRSIYDPDYFQFIYTMVKIFKDTNLNEDKLKDRDLFIAESCNLGLQFLYNTFFKTGKKLRIDLVRWLDLFKELLLTSKEGATTMLNFIVNHEANSSFIRHYMLECPIVEIREACGQLFEYSLNSLIIKYEFQPLNNPKISSLISSCVQLLDKAVIDLCKNSHEYFKFLYNYAELSKETTQQLISMSVFNKLLCFLLGNPGAIKSEESSNRRWSTIQSREFAIVHELIATLILKCNILSLKTCEIPEKSSIPMNQTADDTPKLVSKDQDYLESSYPINDTQMDNQLSKNIFTPTFTPPTNSNDLIQLPQEMQIYLIGALSNRYLKELVFAFEQINHNSLSKTLEAILACCYCNELFSANMIHQILTHINNSSSNEIKQVLILLYNIILIEDPLQLKRLRLAIDGYRDNDIIFNGLLSIVRQNQSSDAKKSYQCVKFIVTLANRSPTCKEYLLKTANNWEWSVNWLKTKMLESLGNSNYSNWTSAKSSNDDSDTRTFQRTKSAQRTLDDATALLRSSEFDI